MFDRPSGQRLRDCRWLLPAGSSGESGGEFRDDRGEIGLVAAESLDHRLKDCIGIEGMSHSVGEQREERELRSAVAFTEGMDGVQLCEKVSGRPIIRKPLGVGPISWLAKDAVGEEIVALLPWERVLLDAATEAALMRALRRMGSLRPNGCREYLPWGFAGVRFIRACTCPLRRQWQALCGHQLFKAVRVAYAGAEEPPASTPLGLGSGFT